MPGRIREDFEKTHLQKTWLVKLKIYFFDKKKEKAKKKNEKIVNIIKYHVLAFYLNCVYLCCTNSVPEFFLHFQLISQTNINKNTEFSTKNIFTCAICQKILHDKNIYNIFNYKKYKKKYDMQIFNKKMR